VVSYFDPNGNLMGAPERFPNIYVAKGKRTTVFAHPAHAKQRPANLRCKFPN
jgi:hypothetical protein